MADANSGCNAKLLRACGLPAEPAADERRFFQLATLLIQRGGVETDAAAAVALAEAVSRDGGQNVQSLPFGYEGPRVEHEGWLRREDLTRWLTQLGGMVAGDRFNADSARLAVEYALREYWLRSERFDAWRPGMPSGSGWTEVVQPQAAGIARATETEATRIHAAGNSPLSQYVDLLVTVPKNLARRLDRDAEAVRILTADPALPEAIRRAERWYWDRQREKQTGKIVGTRRIWTRRDVRRVNLLRGLAEGFDPQCRVARYLTRLEPRAGLSRHDECFRRAADEARHDGTAAVLCPKLEQAKAIFGRLLAAARSVANDEGGRPAFDAAHDDLRDPARELMTWTKRPAGPSGKAVPKAVTVPGDIGDGEGLSEKCQAPPNPRVVKGKNVNARMLEAIQANPEALGWNSREWAAALKCAKSSVTETPTWRDLQMKRERERAEKARDRRRRAKGR